MFQITTDLLSLSQVQREAFAAFILSFSASQVVEDDESDTEEPAVGFEFPNVSEELTDEEIAAIAFGNPAGFSPGIGKTVVLPTGGPSQVDPPASAVTAGGTGLDKAGLPWDERIHASSKAKTQDGGWRMKRGVDPTLVTTVGAELKALMGLPAPVTRIETTVFPPAATFGALSDNGPLPFIVPPPPAAPAAAEVASITASPVVSAPTVAVPPPPPAAPAVNPFISLVTTAGPAVTAGKITEDEVKAICNTVGVPNLALMNNRPDLCPQVLESVRQLLATR